MAALSSFMRSSKFNLEGTQDANELTKSSLVAVSPMMANAQNDLNIETKSIKILNQIEYYFSDANIIDDAFLLDLITKDEGGWVDLSVIANFKKIKSITSDFADVINAAKDSKKLAFKDSPRPAVKRVAPIPARDPEFERRIIVFSISPDAEVKKVKDIQQNFSEASLAPKSIKCYPPFTHMTRDVKSALARHSLPQRKLFLIEFETSSDADKGLKLLRNWLPKAYSKLLSWKKNFTKQSPQTSLSNGKRLSEGPSSVTKPNTKSRDKTADIIPMAIMPDPDRPRIKLRLPDPNQPYVIVTRQPVIPPSEDSVGFEGDWRANLTAAQAKFIPPNQDNSAASFDDPAILAFFT